MDIDETVNPSKTPTKSAFQRAREGLGRAKANTKKALKSRRGQQVAGISLIPVIVITLVFGFVTLSVGSEIMDNIQDQQTADSFAENATEGGLSALAEIGDFGTVIGLVAAAVVVLSLLASGLGGLALRGR